MIRHKEYTVCVSGVLRQEEGYTDCLRSQRDEKEASEVQKLEAIMYSRESRPPKDELTVCEQHEVLLHERRLPIFGVGHLHRCVCDTEYDMDMAERINMPRLAVSYGAHHADRLAQFKPIACIDCFSKIKIYINQ